jgi:hypothetical protein
VKELEKMAQEKEIKDAHKIDSYILEGLEKPESKNECKYCKREHGDLVCREYVNAMVKPECSWEEEFDRSFCLKNLDNNNALYMNDLITGATVKNFISKVEKEAHERGRESVDNPSTK